ncbi:MAG: hypothetical protein U0235_05405 [Polyangiaceae bacterium]
MRIRSSSLTAPFLVPVFVSACGGSPSPAPEAPSAHPHDHAHHDGHHHGAGGPDTLVHRFERADEWAKTFDDPARDAWQKPADVVKAMAIARHDRGRPGRGHRLLRAVARPRRRRHWAASSHSTSRPTWSATWTERGAREGWANVRAAEVASDDPKLAPASVDRILIVDTWHHIANRAAYAAKLKSALEPAARCSSSTSRSPPRTDRRRPTASRPTR